MMDVQPLVTWAAPIVAALATCAGQLALNARFKMADEKRDSARAETQAKRDAEAAWRDSVEVRLSEQGVKVDAVLRGQTTQMRSDLVHRAHRYIDDLHAASTDEKQAFWAEYTDYVAICEANGITNSFIDNIAQQVMELPNRPSKL